MSSVHASKIAAEQWQVEEHLGPACFKAEADFVSWRAALELFASGEITEEQCEVRTASALRLPCLGKFVDQVSIVHPGRLYQETHESGSAVHGDGATPEFAEATQPIKIQVQVEVPKPSWW